MDFTKTLLPGEEHLATFPVNALLGFSLNDKAPEWVHGMTTATIATFQALWKLASGFSGAIAGELHLTNYRLLFLSKGFNLQDGSFSIFLPTLLNEKNLDGWISDQFTINTNLSTHRFVIRDGDKLGEAIDNAQRLAPGVKELSKIVFDNLEIFGAPAQMWKGDPGNTLSTLREKVEAGEAKELLSFAVTNLAELALLAGAA